MPVPEARELAVKAGVRRDDVALLNSVWTIAEAIFDERVEKELIQPTFIVDYPKELSPLAKSYPDRRDVTQRFELYVAGFELANAFSELNDPLDQKERFVEQVRVREAGGEGGYMDLDYIRALEYGMPPAGGMGVGIDRLTMLFTDAHSIRDTILFPLMRPEKIE
jgi:lysyl-tRNA synthetase class 2